MPRILLLWRQRPTKVHHHTPNIRYAHLKLCRHSHLPHLYYSNCIRLYPSWTQPQSVPLRPLPMVMRSAPRQRPAYNNPKHTRLMQAVCGSICRWGFFLSPSRELLDETGINIYSFSPFIILASFYPCMSPIFCFPEGSWDAVQLTALFTIHSGVISPIFIVS